MEAVIGKAFRSLKILFMEVFMSNDLILKTMVDDYALAIELLSARAEILKKAKHCKTNKEKADLRNFAKKWDSEHRGDLLNLVSSLEKTLTAKLAFYFLKEKLKGQVKTFKDFRGKSEAKEKELTH